MTDDDAAFMAARTAPHRPSIQLSSVGRAVNDVPTGATAYAHRHQNTLVIASVFPAQLDASGKHWPVGSTEPSSGFESSLGPGTFERPYPGATGERVVRLWNRYDPDRIFHAP